MQHLFCRLTPCYMDSLHFNIYSPDSLMLHGQPTYQHLLLRCPPCCMNTQHFNIYSSDSLHATWTAHHSTYTLHINAMLQLQPTFQHLLFTLPPQSVICLGRFELHFCDFLLHQVHLISWKPRTTWQKVTGHTSQFYWPRDRPAPALPCPTLPCPALPCLTWPALPCPAVPCPALPCHYILTFFLHINTMLYGQPTFQHLLIIFPPWSMDSLHLNIYP